MDERRATAFAEVVAGIHELLASPCYRWTDYEPPMHLEFDTPEALAAWWWDAGGRYWLSRYLSLSGGKRSVGPDARRALNGRALADPGASLERRALAWMVCRDDEADCGQATAGWARRADSAFALYADRAALRLQRESFWSEDQPAAPTCRAQGLAADPGERYRAFRACIQRVQPHEWALPLGRFRAPVSGWLIVERGNGHSEYCDRLSAYDLATGSAYRASNCSSLELGGGRHAAPSSGIDRRVVTFTTGTLPVDNLRELAFMMLLAPEVERDLVLRPLGFDVPHGIDAVFSSGPRLERSKTEFVRSSAQQMLVWTLVKEGVVTNHGEVFWPSSSNLAEMYVDDLLAVAEGGFVDGCPPAALPTTLPSASGSDAAEGSAHLSDTKRSALLLTLRTGKRPATCKR